MCRQALELTQARLAQMLGVATTTLARWERGERPISSPGSVCLALDRLQTRSSRARQTDVFREGRTLPNVLSSFVGREQQVAEVVRLLATNRLVTLTGAGGVGKTRVAVRVASELLAQFADGVAFVDLGAVVAHELVAASIVERLGLPPTGNRQSTLAALTQKLRDKHLLLVLDNFEQVLPAGPSIAALLSACPQLSVLVTSRAVLHVSGEHIFSLPPLQLPARGEPLPPLEALSRFEGVRLFGERAHAAHADFALAEHNAPVVVELCHRLDGLPLAIELAAAHIGALPAQYVLDRLERRLDLLVDGAHDQPERHQTLRAAVAWSYDLLSPRQQVVLQRLAVFAGGWRLEAAEAIAAACSVDGGATSPVRELVSLVEQGLVQAEEQTQGEPRFRLLESIQAFALERLASSGEEQHTRRQHAGYFTRLAESLGGERIWASDGVTSGAGPLGRERDNIREALEWAANSNEPDLVLRLTDAMQHLWGVWGAYSQGRRWLMRALAAPQAQPRTRLRASLLAATADYADRQADFVEATQSLLEALAIAGEVGDDRLVVRSLLQLGTVAGHQGDYLASRRLQEDALARARSAGFRSEEVRCLGQLGWEACGQGDFERARATADEAVSLSRALASPRLLSFSLATLGYAAFGQAHSTIARQALDEAWLVAQQLGYQRLQADVLEGLGRISAAEGGLAQAWTSIVESLRIRQEMGTPIRAISGVEGLASVAISAEQWALALRLAGAADAQRDRLGVKAYFWAQRADLHAKLRLARAALGRHDAERAWRSGQAMSIEQAIRQANSEVRMPESRPAPAGSRMCPKPGEPAGTPSASSALSRREAQVLRLLGTGESNRAIAATLDLSVRTVERHISNLYAKIGARGRADAAVYAVQRASDTGQPLHAYFPSRAN